MKNKDACGLISVEMVLLIERSEKDTNLKESNDKKV